MFAFVTGRIITVSICFVLGTRKRIALTKLCLWKLTRMVLKNNI